MAVKKTESSAPKHLRAPTRRWFEQICEDYLLESHHVRILTFACEAWDRACEARVLLDEHGLTYLDRFDAPHARPEVAIERDSRAAFARLVRELGLDIAPPQEMPRPPRRGQRGG